MDQFDQSRWDGAVPRGLEMLKRIIQFCHIMGKFFSLKIHALSLCQVEIDNSPAMSESTTKPKQRNVINERSSTTSSPAQDEKYGARPACFKSTLQEILFVVTCTMAIGLSSMTAGVITVISSFVGRDLGMTNAEITWLAAAVSLAAGSFLLFFGKLADLFGRRSMFIGSLFLFSVLALGAGFAKRPIQLDVICGFIGLMSAGAVPPAQGMLGAIYEVPSRRKNAAFACFSSGNPLGFVFGMLSGGIASQVFSWRASFWFLALVYVSLLVISNFGGTLEALKCCFDLLETLLEASLFPFYHTCCLRY
jgi:hypothetical protein